MGIAYSEYDIQLANFPGVTGVQILEGLHSNLVTVGCPYRSIADGYEYDLVSPQLLSCRLKSTLLPDSPAGTKYRAGVQFISWDRNREGVLHKLASGMDFEYQFQGHKCQFFVSRPGISDDDLGFLYINGGRAVCGGVPYVASIDKSTPPELDCNGLIPSTAAECWWSAGDFDSNYAPLDFFRYSWFCSKGFSACYNEDLIKGETLPRGGYESLTIPVLTPTTRMPWSTLPNPAQWTNGDKFLFDPFLAWGTSLDKRIIITAELWDAFMMSSDHALDDEYSYDSAVWRNFTHTNVGSTKGNRNFYGSLFLLKNVLGGGIINYAY